MYDKQFAQSFNLYDNQDSKPLVTALIIGKDNKEAQVDLIFDTGFDGTIVLRSEYLKEYFGFPTLFDRRTRPAKMETADKSKAARYVPDWFSVEIFGRTLNPCIVYFQALNKNIPAQGMFGRAAFQDFGFGFFHKDKQLFVSYV